MKTIVHYYRFDISKEFDNANYKILCTNLNKQGLTLFNCISLNKNPYEKIKQIDGLQVELETDFIFNNQWNTAKIDGVSDIGLRVFDWSSEIYPNKSIKEGMYLDQTDEMRKIRIETYKCNYCGKNYHLPTEQFCTECLNNQYLTKDQLYMLELTPITAGESVNNFVPEWLVEKFDEVQKIARLARLEKRNADKLQSIQKDIESSRKEYAGFEWLINNGIDFENCIYHNHTDTFSFGWRASLSNDQKTEYKLKLAEFPYKYELK